MGPATLKLVSNIKESQPRQIDVIVLTTDKQYRPRIKDRPKNYAWQLLDAWREAIPSDLEPLARRLPDWAAARSVELSAAWKLRTFRDKGFLYLWNTSHTNAADTWLSDKPGRVKFPYNIGDANVRAEFEAGLAAVRGVGILQLTLQAGLSSYDPTYGEFTVGALSPGAVYTFKAQGQTVNLKFDNALTAQSWSVPKDQAQAIVDRIGNDSLLLDATLHIRKVLPGPGGGTVVAHVDSWSLRDSRSGSTVARVKAIKD